MHQKMSAVLPSIMTALTIYIYHTVYTVVCGINTSFVTSCFARNCQVKTTTTTGLYHTNTAARLAGEKHILFSDTVVYTYSTTQRVPTR